MCLVYEDWPKAYLKVVGVPNYTGPHTLVTDAEPDSEPSEIAPMLLEMAEASAGMDSTSTEIDGEDEATSQEHLAAAKTLSTAKSSPAKTVSTVKASSVTPAKASAGRASSRERASKDPPNDPKAPSSPPATGRSGKAGTWSGPREQPAILDLFNHPRFLSASPSSHLTRLSIIHAY